MVDIEMLRNGEDVKCDACGFSGDPEITEAQGSQFMAIILSSSAKRVVLCVGRGCATINCVSRLAWLLKGFGCEL